MNQQFARYSPYLDEENEEVEVKGEKSKDSVFGNGAKKLRLDKKDEVQLTDGKMCL